MTPYLGKRNPGGLTASDPGDTLYIPLSFFNDSGAPVSIGSTLAVTDIEVFKNGGVGQRAVDSGYAILGDTGNFDDRTGFKGISVQLFNTADDTGFYDAGSTYWVAIDGVTVDARTIRDWVAWFEIGTPRANVVEVAGDTGAANHLGQMADEYDTGRLPAEAAATLDTGAVNQAVWAANATRTLTGWSFDTGVQLELTRLDTGLRSVIGDVDTGIHDTIADLDTGLRAFIDDVDTGLHSGASVNITRIVGDTGAAAHLAQFVDETDTGSIQVDVAALSDTGVNERLAAIETKTNSLTFTTANQVDANVQSVNDVSVVGTGASTDRWRPA